jgi:lysophospholipase L1-like esterase
MGLISVTLRRDDDNEIIAQFSIDDTKVYPMSIPPPPPPPPSGSKVLNLVKVNNEYVQLSSEVSFTGVFDIECEVEQGVQEGSWCPLWGGSSVGNRVFISGLSSLVAVNIGGSSLVQKTVTIDMGVKNSIRFYRDVANDVWIQINGGVPVFIMNTTNTFSVKYFGKTTTYEWTGYLHSFRIGSNIFDLHEQVGTTLISTNSAMSAMIKSDITQPHIDDVVWALPPVSTPQVQVINLGVGGNNTQSLLNRMSDVTNQSPDLTIIMIGTNDAVNSSAYINTNQYKINLTSIVTQIKAIGSDVILISMPPVIDAIKKSTHDYTPIYGDENTFDLNVDILPQYRAKMQEVANEQNVVFVDGLAPFTANGDPTTDSTSWITSDGTHLKTSGYLAIAQALLSHCYGYQKIACFGDSLTYGTGGTPYPLQLSQLINS